MNTIDNLLKKYSVNNQKDIINALHEIIQEIALVGLSRAKFFEKAAFYGGTSLRILYGLDRFSEDLDFSLLTSNKHFDFQPYLKTIQEELAGFGINCTAEQKTKTNHSPILSAFLKTNTLETLLRLDSPLKQKTPYNQKIQIKFEIDILPPLNFETEVKFLLNPIPFSIRSFTLPNLFAGKMHALLFRKWKARVKGRDWYDFVWFVSKKIPLNLSHLEARMRDTNDWNFKEHLTKAKLEKLLIQKISTLPIDSAKLDILPFIKDPNKIEVWSKEFFLNLISQIIYE